MANHKPAVPDVSIHDYAPAEAIEGNLLDNATDSDGDLLQVQFVNGTRIPNKAGEAGYLTIEGEHGTLTIFSNGSYSYTVSDPASLASGEVFAEKFSFKISDGKGGTDVANLNIGVHAPPQGPYSIDFENAPTEYPGQPDIASGYAGFKFGDKLDGNLWTVAESGGNEYVVTNPYNPFFDRVDGKLFTVEGVDVATVFDPAYQGVDALVTFEGYVGGNKVSELSLTVYGDTIADGQHISLAALGAVDFIRFDIQPDVEPTGFPQLAFDNFSVLV
ncbi:autoaggregation protein (adhering protein) [Rhizobium phaseoli]|uniref:Ig-like domain-containing protein n=1 Tax=Rhizobium phaseoli TaxID=396 RepID=UPI0002D80B5C|nr:Ig-like domain-containing protein [Rhizobium phaseoli]KKZ89692.1 autoaggregation protein [Rhizobium phaseoli Ch24-10]RDJ10815.1 autoaggregation protein (adhering protein) [Rhizobium phaseoli]RDJ14585.1 autoaggregation protein (adhering protein) [Rhizobium phaseoli]